ncbi:hypothetical protein ACQP1O_34780 [Nocardia sp. CA-151230]|uniref:hypothetical protein n=1 Tax=Nocardia sp. CA-151230 TaxID=3239982 RepID=UPI003D8DBC05
MPRLIDDAVTVGVSNFVYGCRRTEVTASGGWTREQVQIFATEATVDRLHAVFLMSSCGPHRSEVCGLRWTDIDLSHGT